MKYWILSGSEENWDLALRDQIWGVREGRLKNLWDKLNNGDILIFYAKRPTSGVIGFGKVKAKFKQDKPLWQDEIRANQVIYPYRFEFESLYRLPVAEWQNKSVMARDLVIPYQAGLNSFTDQKSIQELSNRIKEKWTVDMEFKLQKEKPTISLKSPHDLAKEMIYEVGKIEKYISEKEYPMDGSRLDVVWRRLEKAVPAYVFEVQIGGNVYQALGKLKHAWDMWNSNLYIIISEKDRGEVNNLLSGTFHEIKDFLKIIIIEDVKKLYELQTSDKELKEKLGL